MEQSGKAQGRVGFLEVLSNQRFRRLWLGQLVSLFGDKLNFVTLLALLHDKPGGSQNLLLLALVQTMAYLCFGLFAGALVDRLDRKRIMVAGDLARAALVLTLPFIDSRGLIFAVSFVITSITLFFEPSRDASIPTIVKREHLLTANSLLQTSRALSDVVGLMVSGVVVWLAGTKLAFFIDSASFVFSAAMIWPIAIPLAASAASSAAKNVVSRVLADVREGLAFLREQRDVASIIVLYIALGLGMGPVNVLLFTYAADVIGLGARAYGLISGSIVAGVLVGSMLLGRFGQHLERRRVMTGGLFFLGALLLALVNTRLLVPAMALAVASGLANSCFFISFLTLFQELVPNEKRGRMFSIHYITKQSSAFISITAATLLATVVSAVTILSISAIIVMAAAALGWFLLVVRPAGERPVTRTETPA